MVFVEGRQIRDNIILCQDFLDSYHKDSRAKKCAIKVDLMKVYDSLDGNFLLSLLRVLGLPSIFTKRIEM